MKILFLIPYPLQQAPSQRFRFEQYFGALAARGIRFDVQSFFTQGLWRSFLSKGQPLSKAWALTAGFFRRLFMIVHAPLYDFVFIHREVTPIGPPVFEWIIAKVLRKKIIYDFDDAIWTTDRTDESFLLKKMKWRSKVGSICRWSYKVSCGNEYLRDYAATFNANAIVNPTTLETEHRHNPAHHSITKDNTKVVIGWTGSYTTLKYLKQIESILNRLQEKFQHLSFVVIADQKPDLELPRMQFIPWNESTEVADLLKFDIGVMPLPDDEWSKGKCGFKALQYMALQIPAVVSPVGVNTKMVEHGKNGYLASTLEEWTTTLTDLISSPELRHQMGIQGRSKVISSYSVVSNTPTFLALFA